MNKEIKIDIISGCEGDCLSINDIRVSGSKPWGGGRIKQSFTIDIEELNDILKKDYISKEEVEELTLSEVCKLLGKDIKIKK